MSWKEVPHLFANGKFTFRYKNDSYLLDGTRQVGNNNYRLLCDTIYEGNIDVHADDCTLIARPISDMTDEEWGTMKGVKFNENQIERRKKWFKIQVLTADDLIYLLSIGVYPFDQSHFGTGQVIDINSLNKK